MRIVVCVKHVPDIQSERRIEDGRVVRGEDDTLNALDEHAIECAVSLVEEYGGEVIAVTMGPQGCEDAVLRALQMGADLGVVITDDALIGSNVVGTARVLAAAIKVIADMDEPIDMVITGMASLDGLTSMLPSALATTLEIPFLGLADDLGVSGEGPWTVSIKRTADDISEELSCSTPVLLSVTDQMNEPRFPSFKTMQAAHSKPLDIWSLSDLADEGYSVDTDDSHTAMAVIHAQEDQRHENGTLITDTGDAGAQLARYIMEEGF